MSKIIFGGIQPNPKEAKVWLHPHDGLKTYNLKKLEWIGGSSSNDAPTDEPESLYEFVDLGLPSGLLWATTNVGATKPEEYGLYFAWGEIEGYTAEDVENGVKQFSWADYKLCGGTDITLIKYNNNSSYGVVDNLTTLELVDDAAYQSDNTCRMPTKEDFDELLDNTTITAQTLNGVNGKKFTSNTNGNSIFVPATGHCKNGSIAGAGSYGFYWSSSLNESNSKKCIALNLNGDYTGVYDNRSSGLTVRPVQNK